MSKRFTLAVICMPLALALVSCATEPPKPSPPPKLITGAQIKHLCPMTMTPVCTSKMNSVPKCSCQGKEELQRLLEDY